MSDELFFLFSPSSGEDTIGMSLAHMFGIGAVATVDTNTIVDTDKPKDSVARLRIATFGKIVVHTLNIDIYLQG